MNMEIPEISMISDFEAGMKCLRNPSIISRLFSFSGIEKVPQVYSFWKWGALILALVAAFSGLTNKIKLFIRVCTDKSSPSSSEKSLLDELSDESELTDDDESASMSSETQELQYRSPFEEESSVDEDFRLGGSSFFQENEWPNGGNLKLRRRRMFGESCKFCWSDFAAGKSVVKLWDSLGLGFDFDDSSEGLVSVIDLSRGDKISSILAGKPQVPAVGTSSPAVVLSAEVNDRDGVVVGAYDRRVGRQIPVAYGKWGRRPGGGKVVGVNSGGVEKVYVEEAGTGTLTVGDMRNVRTPLVSVTPSDGDFWWDADAVFVANDLVDELSQDS